MVNYARTIGTTNSIRATLKTMKHKRTIYWYNKKSQGKSEQFMAQYKVQLKIPQTRLIKVQLWDQFLEPYSNLFSQYFQANGA